MSKFDVNSRGKLGDPKSGGYLGRIFPQQNEKKFFLSLYCRVIVIHWNIKKGRDIRKLMWWKRKKNKRKDNENLLESLITPSITLGVNGMKLKK